MMEMIAALVQIKPTAPDTVTLEEALSAMFKHVCERKNIDPEDLIERIVEPKTSPCPVCGGSIINLKGYSVETKKWIIECNHCKAHIVPGDKHRGKLKRHLADLWNRAAFVVSTKYPVLPDLYKKGVIDKSAGRNIENL